MNKTQVHQPWFTGEDSIMRKFLLPFLFLGVAGCQQSYESYEPQQTRDGYNRSSPDYNRPARHDSGDQCTFQTRRGSVAGYKPSGKDRCCVDTRDGPSCQ